MTGGTKESEVILVAASPSEYWEFMMYMTVRRVGAAVLADKPHLSAVV